MEIWTKKVFQALSILSLLYKEKTTKAHTEGTGTYLKEISKYTEIATNNKIHAEEIFPKGSYEKIHYNLL